MATTTNYGWVTPDDTSLVKDGAAAIRTLGTSVDTTTKNLNPSTTLGDIEYRSSTANTNTRVGIGSSGQNLSVVAGVPAWAASPTSVLTTTGDTLYASAANTLARLGVGTTGQVLTVAGGLPSWATPAAGGFVGASVYRSTAQTLSNDTNTVINFNAEVFDTDGFHDNSTNNSRLTIPTGKGGYYLLNLFVAFESAASGTRQTQIVSSTGDLYCNSSVITAGTPYGSSITTAAVAYLGAGEYFEAKANQRSGGSLNLSSGIYSVNFSCVFLGA